MQFVMADSHEEAVHMRQVREEWIRKHKFQHYGKKVGTGILLAPIVVVGGLLLVCVGVAVIVIAIPLRILFG